MVPNTPPTAYCQGCCMLVGPSLLLYHAANRLLAGELLCYRLPVVRFVADRWGSNVHWSCNVVEHDAVGDLVSFDRAGAFIMSMVDHSYLVTLLLLWPTMSSYPSTTIAVLAELGNCDVVRVDPTEQEPGNCDVARVDPTEQELRNYDVARVDPTEQELRNCDATRVDSTEQELENHDVARVDPTEQELGNVMPQELIRPSRSSRIVILGLCRG
ncbi:hypothetical protein B296_00030653 [Ensete ventricosum]|uniref:Uncharacterized protein n=1 Tax=Ensete ventricosum TaxID=4639 RepID=A0A427A5R7_ENSVE|nr:hypothetical protein B296_00030653 [Ensete ventricosum]